MEGRRHRSRRRCQTRWLASAPYGPASDDLHVLGVPSAGRAVGRAVPRLWCVGDDRERRRRGRRSGVARRLARQLLRRRRTGAHGDRRARSRARRRARPGVGGAAGRRARDRQVHAVAAALSRLSAAGRALPGRLRRGVAGAGRRPVATARRGRGRRSGSRRAATCGPCSTTAARAPRPARGRFDPDGPRSVAPQMPAASLRCGTCADALVGLAKEAGIAVLVTGHVTKDGDLAGPRTLEHAVDVVLLFEGDPRSGLAGARGREEPVRRRGRGRVVRDGRRRIARDRSRRPLLEGAGEPGCGRRPPHGRAAGPRGRDPGARRVGRRAGPPSDHRARRSAVPADGRRAGAGGGLRLGQGGAVRRHLGRSPGRRPRGRPRRSPRPSPRRSRGCPPRNAPPSSVRSPSPGSCARCPACRSGSPRPRRPGVDTSSRRPDREARRHPLLVPVRDVSEALTWANDSGAAVTRRAS